MALVGGLAGGAIWHAPDEADEVAARWFSPKPLDLVWIEIRIDAEDRQVLDDGLRDQHSIEWVLMVERQPDDRGNMFMLNVKDLHCHLLQLLWNQREIGSR